MSVTAAQLKKALNAHNILLDNDESEKDRSPPAKVHDIFILFNMIVPLVRGSFLSISCPTSLPLLFYYLSCMC